MPWNWELPDWPHFRFDPASLVQKERLFLLRAGQILGAFNELTGPEQRDFAADLLTSEGQESALIEGEVLNRESLRSSIQRHFGLKSPQNKKGGVKEESMAELLVCVHETFAQPLTHEMLWLYHRTLFAHTSHLENLGGLPDRGVGLQDIGADIQHPLLYVFLHLTLPPAYWKLEVGGWRLEK